MYVRLKQKVFLNFYFCLVNPVPGRWYSPDQSSSGGGKREGKSDLGNGEKRFSLGYLGFLGCCTDRPTERAKLTFRGRVQVRRGGSPFEIWNCVRFSLVVENFRAKRPLTRENKQIVAS